MLGRFGEQAQAVRDGRADTALLLSPFDDRGLDCEPLVTEPFLVADPESAWGAIYSALRRLCAAQAAARHE